MNDDIEYFNVSNAVYLSIKRVKGINAVNAIKTMQKLNNNRKIIGVSKSIVDDIVEKFKVMQRNNFEFGKNAGDVYYISTDIQLPSKLINHIVKVKKLKN